MRERAIAYDELLEADEVFSTGNWAKVQACTRIEDQHFQPGAAVPPRPRGLLGLGPHHAAPIVQPCIPMKLADIAD